MARSRLIAVAVAAALAVFVAVAVTIVVTDDGGGGDRSPGPGLSATQTVPPGGSDDAAVIQGWADTLASGDVRGAADYFAVPAIVQADPTQPGIRLTERGQVRRFNRLLPCGARLLHSVPHGRYTIATFRLIDRPGANCDAPGGQASTAFLIRDARIVEWRRVPDVVPPDAGGSGTGDAPII
jgi:hypothetical protein